MTDMFQGWNMLKPPSSWSFLKHRRMDEGSFKVKWHCWFARNIRAMSFACHVVSKWETAWISQTERERESGWSVWESQSMWEPQEIIHGISMLRPLDGAEKRSYHLRQGVSKCFKYTTQREINSTLPMYRCILHQPRLLWVGGKLWLRNPLATEEYGATTHTHNTIYK